MAQWRVTVQGCHFPEKGASASRGEIVEFVCTYTHSLDDAVSAIRDMAVKDAAAFGLMPTTLMVKKVEIVA